MVDFYRSLDESITNTANIKTAPVVVVEAVYICVVVVQITTPRVAQTRNRRTPPEHIDIAAKITEVAIIKAAATWKGGEPAQVCAVSITSPARGAF